jgi:5'(3')-deoxyribonucleotidase
MKEKDFILGVDLDGVCADFYTTMREIAAEWMGQPVESLVKEVDFGLKQWKIDEVGGYEPLHRFAVTQRDLFRRVSPIPGASVALRKLSAEGIRIRIITHRLFIKHFHQEAVRQTVEWLDHHGFPYWDLCFMKDKAQVGANIYIDDSPGNVESLRSYGYNVIVFRNSTNEHLAGPGADNWSEVEAIVRKEFEAWKKK